MILVFLVIGIILLTLGLWIMCKLYEEDLGIPAVVIGFLMTVGSIIAAIVLCILVSGQMTIDERIDMYSQENAVIEEQIATMVKQYQEYETDIFTELNPESTITLVALYPELKADALVNRQLEVYINNNEKIKELKSEKIAGRVYRWWLYFGG